MLVLPSYRAIAATALVLIFAITARAGTVMVPVTDDESVIAGSPDKNYDDNYLRGGLYSGDDGGLSGPARFYLKFDLPKYDDSLILKRAWLEGYHCDDFDPNTNGSHAIYFVAGDDWSEKTIDWSNQPGHAYGSPEATIESAASPLGGEIKVDLTSSVRSQFQGDGVISLMFQASNESTDPSNTNWEYFDEKEADPSKAFRLELQLESSQPSHVVVPLPAAAWAGGAMLGAMGMFKALRRKRAIL
ncbi:MAG TPA: DNRLRE domain-containing protein [Tepidisphaeraceae bacterium]|jgi:hypothetical protein|nr:DNRLRE domain-containing protein [Tepidisphaeraceae bacterium]